jgi:hypothetical protein
MILPLLVSAFVKNIEYDSVIASEAWQSPKKRISSIDNPSFIS